MITIPGTTRQIQYDPMKRIGVMATRLGTSEATALGAYLFAVDALARAESTSP